MSQYIAAFVLVMAALGLLELVVWCFELLERKLYLDTPSGYGQAEWVIGREGGMWRVHPND